MRKTEKTSFETMFEDEIIMRRDRKRTITVFADPIAGQASELFARVRPQIEAIDLPVGYELEWGGEYEDSGNARAGLAGGCSNVHVDNGTDHHHAV